jgi:hypothetical protein
MFFTNDRGYPKFIVDIVIQLYNSYSKGDADFSVTEIIGSPLERVLKERHKDEMQIDVDRLMFMFFGTMAHAVAEKATMDYIIETEHRMFIKHDGMMISGQLDVLYKERGNIRIDDIKFTGKGVSKDGAKRSWIRQANLYRFMYNKTKNVLADELGILAYFRNSTMYEMKCARIPISCFPLDKVEKFLSTQIALHKLIDWEVTSKIPECTPDDRWATEETWAVMPNKKKTKIRSLKNCTSEAEALNYLDKKVDKYPDAFVEHRPMYNRKCYEACDVASFCWYKQDLDAGYVTDSYNCKGDETPVRRKINKT